MTIKAKKQTHTTKGLKPPRKHQAKTHAKIYWPYLPLIAILFGAAFLNIWQPLQSSKPATLAYATEMSRSGLLASTNSQRASNGRAALSLNSQLNASAQAKANDMVARNYWSHNTPEGQAPWVFIDGQGYVYAKAGENLAYGYATSNAAVIGWMNSTQGHRENMLDSTFTEVGFGFANSAAYVPNTLKPEQGPFSSVGNQTIVVAHYAKPVVAAATTPEPAPTPPTPAQQSPEPQPQTINESTTNEDAELKPVENEAVEEIEVSEDIVLNEEETDNTNSPINTNNTAINEAESIRTSRIQILTGGAAPWSALVLSIAAFSLAVVWIVKHFVIVKRYIIEGEHFVAHHPVLDLIVLTIIAVAVYLSQTSGVIL